MHLTEPLDLLYYVASVPDPLYATVPSDSLQYFTSVPDLLHATAPLDLLHHVASVPDPLQPSEPLDILHHFASVPDPRDARFITHRLLDLLVIALCATLSGGKSFEDMAAFGRVKETWLRSLGLALPNGSPSHDTFRDLFRHLSPTAFQDAFTAWINAVGDRLGIKHVQIDGKVKRGSRGPNGTCLYLVSAWVGANSLTLGQVAVEDKSNEITASPKLLKLLELEGALVSIDAMGCQKEIAHAIRNTKGDYLLQVKGNQPILLADISAQFEAAFAADSVGFTHDLWVSHDGAMAARRSAFVACCTTWRD